MSDRKYRHRGYQDDDRDDRQPDRSRRAPMERGKPRLEGAPRGRGVGPPGDVVFKCALCGKPAGTLDPIEPTNFGFAAGGGALMTFMPMAAEVRAGLLPGTGSFWVQMVSSLDTWAF